MPLLLRWPEDAWPSALPPPRIARGATLDGLVELRDVAPTLLHAAGALPPDAAALMDGRSVLCLLVDPSGRGSAAAQAAATDWSRASREPPDDFALRVPAHS